MGKINNQMNQTKLLLTAFSLFVAFSLFSCDDEPIDGLIDLGDFNEEIIDNEGGTSTGDYWPAALNNQWILSQNGVNQDPMKIISINSINGNTYYTFNQAMGSGSSTTGSAITRLRKTSGNYYLKVEDLDIDFGGGITGQQTGFEMLLLKDYLNNGQTWTGSYNQTTTYNNPLFPTINLTINYTGEIINNSTSLSVNGTTYNNVINMRLTQITNMPGAPPTEIETDYWFAKDVGPIKSITYDPASGSPQYTSLLQSYILN